MNIASVFRNTALAAAFAMAALPAAAHQLSVFAKVEGESILIDAKFADGRPVAAGTLRILDAAGEVIHEAPVTGELPISFPIGTHTDGLRIEVDAEGGHDNYWLLTPADLAGKAPE